MRRTRLLLFVLAALAAAGFALRAASDPEVSIVRPPAGTPLFDEVVVARTSARYPAVVVNDQVEAGLRQLYVMVHDRRGERVLGLERGDFTVRDEGQPQQLVTFEGGDIPFTAVLLLDGSGSMRGGGLEIALAGARSFVSGMREHDDSRLVVYSDAGGIRR